MLRQQKLAWFHLLVFTAAVSAVLLLILLVGLKTAPAGFALLGLSGLDPILFRRRRDAKEVEVDERDREIARQANLFGFVASYLAFILTCMGLWAWSYLIRKAETINIHLVTLPVWIAFAVVIAVRAVVMLARYGRENGDAAD